MKDLAAELWAVQHLTALSGMNVTNIRDAKTALGPVERGLDVVFDLDGRRVRAQHTIFHADEGQAPGKLGRSPERRKRRRRGRRRRRSACGALPTIAPRLRFAFKRNAPSRRGTTPVTWSGRTGWSSRLAAIGGGLQRRR